MQTEKNLSKSNNIREETRLQDSQCGPAEADPEQSHSVTEQSTKYLAMQNAFRTVIAHFSVWQNNT